jgi:hypothetical protein
MGRWRLRPPVYCSRQSIAGGSTGRWRARWGAPPFDDSSRDHPPDRGHFHQARCFGRSQCRVLAMIGGLANKDTSWGLSLWVHALMGDSAPNGPTTSLGESLIVLNPRRLRGPDWVRLGLSAMSARGRLLPRKRTSTCHHRRSQKCQKLTLCRSIAAAEQIKACRLLHARTNTPTSDPALVKSLRVRRISPFRAV